MPVGLDDRLQRKSTPKITGGYQWISGYLNSSPSLDNKTRNKIALFFRTVFLLTRKCVYETLCPNHMLAPKDNRGVIKMKRNFV